MVVVVVETWMRLAGSAPAICVTRYHVITVVSTGEERCLGVKVGAWTDGSEPWEFILRALRSLALASMGGGVKAGMLGPRVSFFG